MWELDYKESWAPKNRCFWTVVLEKTLDSPLDCKEIQLVNYKGNQSWIFIGRTDAEAETPILWPPDAKSWLIWKDPDAGKNWRQEEKGTTEGEMAGWDHQLDGRESEWTLGAGDGQVSLTCCSLRGRKESDMTQWLNWTELNPFEGTAPGHYHVHSIMFIKILNNIHQNHQGTLQVFRIMTWHYYVEDTVIFLTW